jgi:hypothetical protein
MAFAENFQREKIHRWIMWTLDDHIEDREFDEYEMQPVYDDEEDDLYVEARLTVDHLACFLSDITGFPQPALLDAKLELQRVTFPIQEKLYDLSNEPLEISLSKENKMVRDDLAPKLARLRRMAKVVDHILYERLLREAIASLPSGSIPSEIDLSEIDTPLGPVRKMKENLLDSYLAEQSAKPSLINACRKECESRRLVKDETIRPEIKYEIAVAIGLPGVGPREKFKPGNKAYQLVSKMLSELGYKRKSRMKE